MFISAEILDGAEALQGLLHFYSVRGTTGLECEYQCDKNKNKPTLTQYVVLFCLFVFTISKNLERQVTDMLSLNELAVG